MMKIACIGAGHVGGPSMAVIAARCPHLTVVAVDTNHKRIEAWNSSVLPIYEPGLDEILQSCRGRNLFFDTNIEKHVFEADIIFVSVNTPTKQNGIGKGKAADLTYWERSARLIASVSTTNKIIVEKSTVPVRAADAIDRVLERNRRDPTIHFEILSNPEFLSEGTAVQDLLHPDRVLIGGKGTATGQEAIKALRAIYAEWIPTEKILSMSLWSAELSKLAANAFLAQRVSSVNAVSAICEATGADINEVTRAVGMDSRIGSSFLNPSVGFGGSCFQKDLLNLIYMCETLGLKEVAEYWNQVLLMNEFQKSRFVHRVVSAMFYTVSGKRIAIFGFAFKKNTADTRMSPAIDICQGLLTDGGYLSIYDPKVTEDQIQLDLLQNQLPNGITKRVEVVDCPYEACRNADAICVLTEWDEFQSFDYEKAFQSMKKPAFLFDGRNILDVQKLKDIGFVIYGIGKPLDAFYSPDL